MLLQLVLEKVCLAIGGMFMLIGAGLHIAKEVGWLVSKGEATLEDHSICSTSSEALQARNGRPDINNTGSAPHIFAVDQIKQEVRIAASSWICCAGTMYPPTGADCSSPKFWVNWTTWWVSNLLLAARRPACTHCIMVECACQYRPTSKYEHAGSSRRLESQSRKAHQF